MVSDTTAEEDLNGLTATLKIRNLILKEISLSHPP